MPIFEYKCGSCGEQFERLVLRSSPAPECPSCEGGDLEKVVSLTAVNSDHSRARALQGARERVGKVRYEKEYEEHRTAHKHGH